MAKKRSQNNSLDFFKAVSKLFNNGPQVRMAIPKDIRGARNPEINKLYNNGQYLGVRDPYMYNQADRFYRYEDFAMMEFTPIISKALDVYAAAVAGENENGKTVIVRSNNPKIKEILNILFDNTLNLSVSLYPLARNLCKYGDFYWYIKMDPNYGIVGIDPIPIDQIEREEKRDLMTGETKVNFRVSVEGAGEVNAFQIAHFRLPFNDQFFPYGTSVLDSSRKIWRMICLLEDALMVYRIVRAPERRVFNIEVGNIPPEDVPQFMEEQKTNMNRQIIANDATGRLDLRHSAMSMSSDYFVPMRGGEGTKIDTLSGGQWNDGINDLEYLQAQLFTALGVPKPYLNYMDSADSAKSALTEMNVIFAKYVRRIQDAVISELKNLALMHLYAFGFDVSVIRDFDIELASSSMLEQQQRMETYRQKFEILSSVPDDIPKRLIYKQIFNWDDSDIEEMTKDKIKEAKLHGIITKLRDGNFDDIGGAGSEFGLGGYDDDFGGEMDQGGDDFDFGGGGDDFGGGDLGGDFDFGGDEGDLGGEETTDDGGGSEPSSEVEDLFAGPFDPKGGKIQFSNDEKDRASRRKKQASSLEKTIKDGIATIPMSILKGEDLEVDNQGREIRDPVSKKIHDRKRAPGGGRKVKPGNSKAIVGNDRTGTGRRHIKVAQSNPSDRRYSNDLIKPERDIMRLESHDLQSRGYKKSYIDKLKSLEMNLSNNSILEVEDPIMKKLDDDLEKMLSDMSKEDSSKGETENDESNGALRPTLSTDDLKQREEEQADKKESDSKEQQNIEDKINETLDLFFIFNKKNNDDNEE